jgi:hypothetical protein
MAQRLRHGSTLLKPLFHKGSISGHQFKNLEHEDKAECRSAAKVMQAAAEGHDRTIPAHGLNGPGHHLNSDPGGASRV